MQIFQRLFKAADEQGVQNHTTPKDQEDKPKEIVPSKNNKKKRSKSKKFKPLIFLCNKDIAKACFYSSIYLKKVDSCRTTRQQQPHSQAITKMKKEGLEVVSQKSDSSKVSPLTEAQVAVSSSKKDQKNKTKAISRMKELLRWAASAKSEKKLSKKVDGRRLNTSESPKISFRWEAQSCSAVSSAISGISMTSSLRNDEACNLVSLNSTVIHGLNRCSTRRGNWITTDSEFMTGDGMEKMKFGGLNT
ncbi:Gag protease polyprotein [Hibiscus syriacus]|uniref:Gag protease polyprotein n=1 Tax=Hibiscus syriacus TaxID=106335 RepID=A0A6A2YEV8_HIBSY|nr:Gag protease polyprotein [Hibiscus syriacus]